MKERKEVMMEGRKEGKKGGGRKRAEGLMEAAVRK